jgi:hypothetical protein
MPYKISYPEHLRTKYLHGQPVPDYDHTEPYIINLSNGGYRCTCGNELSSLHGWYTHKKTIGHLLRTKQISEKSMIPLKQQRDNLIQSGKTIW